MVRGDGTDVEMATLEEEEPAALLWTRRLLELADQIEIADEIEITDETAQAEAAHTHQPPYP